MPTSKPQEELADSTKRVYDMLQRANLNPRVRMALRMYAFGACKTLTEAAECVGLSTAYLSMKKNSPAGKVYMESAQQILDDKTANTSQVLDRLGRRALGVIGKLMEGSTDERVQLRAATDLADRSPSYSKVQKMQVESFTLGTRDAKAIAEALVAGKSVNEQFKEIASGDFDRVGDPKLLTEGTDGTRRESDTQHS